jgi:hypothetical protein
MRSLKPGQSRLTVEAAVSLAKSGLNPAKPTTLYPLRSLLHVRCLDRASARNQVIYQDDHRQYYQDMN